MKILAIGAHFDDVELNCAGTLLRAREEGHETYLVVCTDGSLGHTGYDRRAEQKKVNKLVGYKKVFYLGFKDGGLVHDNHLIDKLTKIILQVKPDLIYTHCEDDFHQDHRAVSLAVKSVNRFSLFSGLMFPSQDPKQNFQADYYSDISDYFFDKLSILRNFKSQLKKPWLQEDFIRARNLGIGKQKYSEKFKVRYMFV